MKRFFWQKKYHFFSQKKIFEAKIFWQNIFGVNFFCEIFFGVNTFFVKRFLLAKKLFLAKNSVGKKNLAKLFFDKNNFWQKCSFHNIVFGELFWGQKKNVSEIIFQRQKSVQDGPRNLSLKFGQNRVGKKIWSVRAEIFLIETNVPGQLLPGQMSP